MPKKLDSATLTNPQLEELAAVGLTDQEISNLLGITQRQWQVHYPEVITRGRARLRQSLRRAQIKSALSGNASMLIWLGKRIRRPARHERYQPRGRAQGYLA